MPAHVVRRGEPAFAATLVVAETFLLIQLDSEPDSAVIGTPFNDFRIFHTAWSIAKNFSDTANVVSD